MNKVSIQTAHFISESEPQENYTEKFEMLDTAGFDAVDYNINSALPSGDIVANKHSSLFDMDVDDLCDFLKPFKVAAHKSNIFFGQMHAPYPPYVIGNKSMNKYLMESFKKSIAVAAFLECPYVVVHPINVVYSLGQAEEHRLNMEMYTELIPCAKKYGVTVCLENMFQAGKGHVYEASCSDFREAAKYIDDLNTLAGSECFGFCYDVGHANLLGKNNRASLGILGNRVKALHIHDNNTREDLHLLPFTYATNWGIDLTTDWNGFIAGLADIDYKGTISFETHQIYHVFPKSVYPQMLSLAAAIGRHFSDEIEKIRKTVACH